jgi:hypothetical protein
MSKLSTIGPQMLSLVSALLVASSCRSSVALVHKRSNENYLPSADSWQEKIWDLRHLKAGEWLSEGAMTFGLT